VEKLNEQEIRKVVVPHVEWHIADACNFSCEGCAHYSHLNLSKVMTVAELEMWYKTWSNKIIPKRLCILGGETLLNKKVIDILYMTRQYWNDPKTLRYDFITNGSLLYKYDKVLPKALLENNFVLNISIHDTTLEYKNYIEPQIRLAASWAKEYGIKVRFEDCTNGVWRKTFLGEGYDITPFNSDDYEESWNNCPAGQECYQLYDNKIYKCAPLAYIQTVKHKLKNPSAWDYYSSYVPLDEHATPEEIEEFYSRKAEPYCAMCPSKTIFFDGAKNPIKKFIKIKNENQ
jgi:MoaA/NifB/PqqE/SkfB family radical SAM enzyme